MQDGYTQPEAEGLIDQVFETLAMLNGVPPHTRGRVIGTIDAGDHWNVLIEWERPHLTTSSWYDKFDVQHSMRPIGFG